MRRTSPKRSGRSPAAKAWSARQDWPGYDEALCSEDLVTVVVQINGKLRDRLEVAKGTDVATLEKLALESEGAQRILQGNAPRKVVVVQDRLVNIVA